MKDEVKINYVIDSCALDARTQRGFELKDVLRMARQSLDNLGIACESLESNAKMLSQARSFFALNQAIFLHQVLRERAAFYAIVRDRIEKIRRSFFEGGDSSEEINLALETDSHRSRFAYLSDRFLGEYRQVNRH